MAEILGRARVVPVLEVARADDAVPLARALAAGGLTVIEVTLRTAAALAAVAAILDRVPACTVGVGSIRDGAMLRAARDSGAAFGVSPGTNPDLLDAACATDWPFLPGAATVSEVMALGARGLTVQKLFPAALLGGTAFLRAVAGPLPDVRFCPTGGITAETAADFLALGNVLAVGGTWIAPRDLVARGDWDAITRRAAAAAAL
ncbi:MAG: bifunctional 4-hydroxy-2-oxoglutarate aldolase/2-dehydro-3-deoxy-phosphogluconate aldolase [Hyphomicrobiales bacterium]|nr:bifunctional 4-hydroxy-2-oxoglutarate aldolase/2-dehydro-3-deoxy-phosphogluconate aldolase [Hyphomicrobiales bacterium]MCP5370281.1 bifunctional 4-hydroxy-2-oxoglutarate aldolase/2-dehydro-3-deoxy-phosphogluconate aldolase [Hyphomicrobiales bacterium]